MSFRPSRIGQIFGQDHIQELLLKWEQDISLIPQSLLLAGPYGTGKTSIARILARQLITAENDLYEINASESRGIDDVRGWAEATRFSPFGKSKVFIADELHQLTPAAQSALLKVIEEPPKGTYWFLCTTDPAKLLPAIRSRCTPLEIKLLTKEANSDLLTFVTKGALSAQLIDQLYYHTAGHARDAVKAAEIAISSGIQNIEQMRDIIGASPEEIRRLLCNLLAGQGNPEEFIPLIKMPDSTLLTSIFDNLIDEAAMKGNLKVSKNYCDFLKMRALRKQWLISSQEQVLHAITICLMV